MEKKQTDKEAEPKTESAAFDAKWMKHWEERQCHTGENADKEIANMDHADFSLLLQEIEHH